MIVDDLMNTRQNEVDVVQHYNMNGRLSVNNSVTVSDTRYDTVRVRVQVQRTQ